MLNFRMNGKNTTSYFLSCLVINNRLFRCLINHELSRNSKDWPYNNKDGVISRTFLIDERIFQEVAMTVDHKHNMFCYSPKRFTETVCDNRNFKNYILHFST